MLSIYLVTGEGVTEEPQVNEALDHAKEQKGILWVDLRSYGTDEIKQIAGRFHLHAVEVDSLHDDYTRPHVFEYEDHLHANFTYIDDAKEEFEAHEFHVFLAESYIITAITDGGSSRLVDEVIERYRDLPSLVNRGTYYTLYLLVDLLVDTYIELADDTDNQVDNLEDEMSNRADRQTLQELFRIKRKLFDLRRYLAPQRDVFNQLARGGFSCIDDHHEPYFQDVYNRMGRVFDVMDSSRDILSGTLDLYQSTVSNRLNDIMKILTVFAVILGVFSFITGYFGMNLAEFPKIPLWRLSIWSIGVAVVTTGALIFWFRRKGWL